MQILFNTDVRPGAGRGFEAGQSYDLDPAQANRYIAQGVATLSTDRDGRMPAADFTVADVLATKAAVSRYGKDPNTVVLFGDSISVYNGAQNGGFWDSKGFFVWANILLGGRLRVLNNAGIAGQTSTQILARFETDVAAYSPGFVNVLAGTNDVAQPSITDAASCAAAVAATTSNLAAIYDKCIAIVSRPIAHIIPPRTGLTAIQLQCLNQINAWIRNYCRSQPGVILCDMGAATADPATNWAPRTGYTVETSDPRVHPNSPAAALWGKRLAAVLAPLVPECDVMPMGSGSYDNLIANPYLNGTGTSAPTSWGSSGAGTISYVTRTDGLPGKWCQVAVANGAAHNITSNTSVGAAMPIGSTVYAAVEVQCDSLDAAPAANTQSFHVFLQCYNGSTFTTKSYAAYWDTSYANCPFPGAGGIFTTAPMVIPAGTTLVQLVVTMNGGGNYRIGRAALRLGSP